MADNVNITPGSGATVRTVDNGSGYQKQVVVLDVGGENAESLVGAGGSNGLPTISANIATYYTGQAKIAVTGTQVQISSSSHALVNGVIVKARNTNAAAITVGLTGVTNTADGTGNGCILDPGEAMSFAVNNVNLLYINGTAGDMVSYAGN